MIGYLFLCLCMLGPALILWAGAKRIVSEVRRARALRAVHQLSFLRVQGVRV